MDSGSILGRLAPVVGACLLASLLAGCGVGGGAGPVPCAGAGKPVVVAAENFWGSIAGQLAGDRACVASIIANPDTDPHAYEAKPNDARLIAGAGYFIENGAGYDPWAPKLVAANPVAGRLVLDVGRLSGKKEGDNPHLWYSPALVGQVVDRIGSDLASIDPAGAAYFQQRTAQYKTVALKPYFDTIATIRQKYAGTPVGASESVFSYLADALGLNLVTPYGYLKAISDGTEPSAADKVEVDREITSGSIKVFVYNSQNTTRDVVALVDKAKARKIPITTVTETLAPANLSFQDWQARQLTSLLGALGG